MDIKRVELHEIIKMPNEQQQWPHDLEHQQHRHDHAIGFEHRGSATQGKKAKR